MDSRRRRVLVVPCLRIWPYAWLVTWGLFRENKNGKKYSTSEYRRVSIYASRISCVVTDVQGMKMGVLSKLVNGESNLLHVRKFYKYCECTGHSPCCFTSLILSEIEAMLIKLRNILSLYRVVYCPFLTANSKVLPTAQYPLMNVITVIYGLCVFIRTYIVWQLSLYGSWVFFTVMCLGTPLLWHVMLRHWAYRIPSSHFAE
jgi:hypothetical protein